MYKYKKFFLVMDKTIRDFSDEDSLEEWEGAVETVKEFANFNYDFIKDKKERLASAWHLFVEALLDAGEEENDNPLHPVAVSLVEMINPPDFPLYHYSLVIGSELADGVALDSAIAGLEEYLNEGNNRCYETIEGNYWLNRDMTVTLDPKLVDVSKQA